MANLNNDLVILAVLLSAVFGLLIWGRWRYDLVAFTALVVALLAGVVPTDQAFSGFGHPATVIIALVLIASRGLSNSGAIELMTRHVIDASRKLATHIAVMTGFAAALSALMNNVAALALLMPVDLEAARKAKRSPSLTLMPLSFATILGGMITLIGTPPNIVIAEYRNDALGESFRMFDFAPVGIACTIVGLLFIATIGWRLIPSSAATSDKEKELIELEGYVAEVQVPEDAPVIGKRVRELDDNVEEYNAVVLGLVRRGQRLPGMARRTEIRAGDVLVLHASPSAIDALVGEFGLRYDKDSASKSLYDDEDLAMLEVVVPEDARIAGRSALSVRLLGRHGVLLVGVSRQGKRFRERVRGLQIQPGDVLLLLGQSDRLSEIAAWMGCMSLAERGLQVVRRDKAWQAVTIFGAAIVLASTGVIYLPVALAATVALMVMLGIVALRQGDDSVAWPVVVLLGSMIPLGAALESSGGTAIIADFIVAVTSGLSPAFVLALLIAVTMTLSDVMNNTATAVIAAPVALEIAARLGVDPDPFLMGVAVAASCAFLTPIGHKNNTLILGPGGYRFGEYWRIGLQLEVLIVLVSTPMILWVWPLYNGATGRRQQHARTAPPYLVPAFLSARPDTVRVATRVRAATGIEGRDPGLPAHFELGFHGRHLLPLWLRTACALARQALCVLVAARADPAVHGRHPDRPAPPPGNHRVDCRAVSESRLDVDRDHARRDEVPYRSLEVRLLPHCGGGGRTLRAGLYRLQDQDRQYGHLPAVHG